MATKQYHSLTGQVSQHICPRGREIDDEHDKVASHRPWVRMTPLGYDIGARLLHAHLHKSMKDPAHLKAHLLYHEETMYQGANML
jgi:hypothetical protein